MKKVFLLVFFFQVSLQAENLNSVDNNIKFLPNLRVPGNENLLQILLPKSMSKERIIRATIEQQINFNGFRIPAKGNLYIPASTLQELSDILFNLKLTGYRFEDGILVGQYELDAPSYQKSIKVTLSTEPYVKIYQCPMPELITVQNQQETGLVLIESVPACTALDIKKADCAHYVTRYYCPRSSLKNSERKGLYYQESTYGKFHNDQTDQHKGLMHFKIISYKGSDKIYTYDLESFFGPLHINSSLQVRHLISDNGNQITEPEKVSKLNRGFAVDGKDRPIDHNGNLIFPSCSKMTIEKLDGLVCVRCIYGDNPDMNDNFILEKIIAHGVDPEESTIVDFSTNSFSNLGQQLRNNKKIELPCTDKHGKKVAPPLIVCKK